MSLLTGNPSKLSSSMKLLCPRLCLASHGNASYASILYKGLVQQLPHCQTLSSLKQPVTLHQIPGTQVTVLETHRPCNGLYSYARSNLCAGLSSHAHFIDLSIKSHGAGTLSRVYSQSIEQMGYHASLVDAVGPHLRPLLFSSESPLPHSSIFCV